MLNSEDFQSTCNFLQKSTESTASDVKQLILYQLKWDLKQRIGPKFFEILNKCSKLDNPSVLEHFAKAVSFLHAELGKFLTLSTEANCKDDVLLYLKAILFHTIEQQIYDVVRTVYRRTFSCFYQLQHRGESECIMNWVSRLLEKELRPISTNFN